MIESLATDFQFPETLAGDTASPFDSSIGERIQHCRKRRRMTLDQVASRLGCSKSVLSEIENGIRTVAPDRAKAIAEILAVAPDFLLTGRKQSSEEVVSRKLIEFADELAISSVGGHVDVMTFVKDLREWNILFSTLGKLRQCARNEIRSVLDAYANKSEYQSDVVSVSIRILTEAMQDMGDVRSYPRAWVLHEVGKMRLLIGLFVACQQLDVECQSFFLKARSAFEESLRLKFSLPLKPEHILPTRLKLLEMQLDNIHLARTRSLADIRAISKDVRALHLQYHSLARLRDDPRALSNGEANCLLFMARSKYLEAKIPPRDASERANAIKACEEADSLALSALEGKRYFGDADFELATATVRAKCALRRAELEPTNQSLQNQAEEDYFSILGRVDRVGLRDLRSLCSLSTLRRDLERKRDEKQAWAAGLLDIFPGPFKFFDGTSARRSALDTMATL